MIDSQNGYFSVYDLIRLYFFSNEDYFKNIKQINQINHDGLIEYIKTSKIQKLLLSKEILIEEDKENSHASFFENKNDNNIFKQGIQKVTKMKRSKSISNLDLRDNEEDLSIKRNKSAVFTKSSDTHIDENLEEELLDYILDHISKSIFFKFLGQEKVMVEWLYFILKFDPEKIQLTKNDVDFDLTEYESQKIIKDEHFQFCSNYLLLKKTFFNFFSNFIYFF